MSDGSAESVYRRLRELAYEDPLETKSRLLGLLNEKGVLALSVLAASDDERGARFRQIAARGLGGSPSSERLKQIFETWLTFERDEFSAVAIREAIAATGPLKKARAKRPVLNELAELEGTYSYVSGRLRHRVLNALPSTGMTIKQLRTIVLEAGNRKAVEAATLLDELYGQLSRLEKAVEFGEDQAYFQRDAIELLKWIKQHQAKFTREFGRVAFELSLELPAERILVDGTPYYLETVFTNLWKNSLDEVGANCAITLLVARSGGEVTVTVFDNGSGFSGQDRDRAFQYQFSSKSRERGRGHMEVRDAMERMGGSARVVRTTRGYRVQLSFKAVAE